MRKFDGEWPARFEPELMDYISLPEEQCPEAKGLFESPSVDREYFEALGNQFRSPHLWDYVDGKWQLRRTVFGENR